ncbi:MAG: histidinol-phosphate transaminase [Planctomycetes bacterium]|nr:histidinol-phosphate transaminase [Planctomycetota bacterium]
MTKSIRPAIRAMAGYVPGEQPCDAGYIKLNTNENPYPPSPRVREAIQQAVADGECLRKYPDPSGSEFCRVVAATLGVAADGILLGNGSDDVLTIITRAFVHEGGLVVSPSPSYLLYRTLAEIQGAKFQAVPFNDDWTLPDPWPIPDAQLTLVANPNSPSGTVASVAALTRLAGQLAGPLVVDEAYVDFADGHAMELARLPNVIVTRSFSKSYGLAGLRLGFAVAQPALIAEFFKVKDSYNCDALSLIGGAAALQDQAHFQATRARVRATRARLEAALRGLGFEVCPSQANFVWCRRQAPGVRGIFEQLKAKKILVRHMVYEGYGEGLRISVGTDAEIDRLLEELQKLV